MMYTVYGYQHGMQITIHDLYSCLRRSLGHRTAMIFSWVRVEAERRVAAEGIRNT